MLSVSDQATAQELADLAEKSLTISDIASGTGALAQIGALIKQIEQATGTEANTKMNVSPDITGITFTFTQRSAQFDLTTREFSFKLKQRKMLTELIKGTTNF